METDLAITGKPAQFGRGVMQDVSDKLLGQFVACLEQRLTAPGPSGGESATESGADSVAQSPPDGSAPSGGVSATGPDAEKVAQPPPKQAPTPVEALDLGSAVLPVVVRSYWKHAVAALAGLAIGRRLLLR